MGSAWVSPGVRGSLLTGAYGRGMSLPKRREKHSIVVLCGGVKATFGADLVCVAVWQGETMYYELCR